jgi:hypothetical protein
MNLGADAQSCLLSASLPCDLARNQIKPPVRPVYRIAEAAVLVVAVSTIPAALAAGLWFLVHS